MNHDRHRKYPKAHMLGSQRHLLVLIATVLMRSTAQKTKPQSKGYEEGNIQYQSSQHKVERLVSESQRSTVPSVCMVKMQRRISKSMLEPKLVQQSKWNAGLHAGSKVSARLTASQS